MDYLQYINKEQDLIIYLIRFKPYYKWITFNIIATFINEIQEAYVLNLIINGLPSISKWLRTFLTI